MTVNLKRLKAERIASGMTQDEVAHRMGWKTRTPYAKRENGIVSIGADELAKITLIFGLPMEKITIFFDNNVPEVEHRIAQRGVNMNESFLTILGISMIASFITNLIAYLAGRHHLKKKIKNHKVWFNSEIDRIKKEYHL